ncbi:hypothetical protein BKA66DRAFT_444010 [Pyrenochaeta sp. MPI-SDFR-AT-0127]|nr:hypothetical protein BKA66DRAFT_444010 [Pyrenochaeta sp. MPI-SDFR-AT-0127]
MSGYQFSHFTSLRATAPEFVNNVDSSDSSSQAADSHGLPSNTPRAPKKFPDLKQYTKFKCFEDANKLMNPEKHRLTDDGKSMVLDKVWAIGMAGKERFVSAGGHHYLAVTDPLYEHGEHFGLSPAVLKWLKSHDHSITLDVNHFRPVKIPEK